MKLVRKCATFQNIVSWLFILESFALYLFSRVVSFEFLIMNYYSNRITQRCQTFSTVYYVIVIHSVGRPIAQAVTR